MIFFLSGASALIFEQLWFRQAGLALGNSVWASSLVLAGFMGGLAIGNGVVARIGHRVRRPVALYAGLEVAIATTGIALVHLLPALSPLLAPILRPLLDVPLAANAIRLGSAFLLLLVPSVAMGSTLPLLVAALHRRQRNFGQALGLLYGWNTIGAVAGVIVGEAVLIDAFGIRTTAWIAGGVNLLAAGIAWILSGRLDTGGASAIEAPAAPMPRRTLWFLAAAFMAGACLLGLEVAWFRFLILFGKRIGAADVVFGTSSIGLPITKSSSSTSSSSSTKSSSDSIQEKTPRLTTKKRCPLQTQLTDAV